MGQRERERARENNSLVIIAGNNLYTPKSSDGPNHDFRSFPYVRIQITAHTQKQNQQNITNGTQNGREMKKKIMIDVFLVVKTMKTTN